MVRVMSNLKEKGSKGINRASKERNDTTSTGPGSTCIRIADDSIANPATSRGLKKLFRLRPQVTVAPLNEKENVLPHLRAPVFFIFVCLLAFFLLFFFFGNPVEFAEQKETG